MIIFVVLIALLFGAILGTGMFFLYRFYKLRKKRDLFIGLGTLVLILIANIIVSSLLPSVV